MLQFSTVDLAQQISAVTDAAAQAPVEITYRRKPRFVLMSLERYREITNAGQQRSFTLDTMPDELARGLLAAARAYEVAHADD